MKIFAILGDPVEHSLSPVMQNAALRALGVDGCYIALRVAHSDLSPALHGAEAMGFAGLNLTIPLKEKALEMDFLRLDPLAEAIGAVNTIAFAGRKSCPSDTGYASDTSGMKDTNGLSMSGMTGYNTDGWGALLALQRAGVAVKGSRVLLIGAGGAARAIGYTLAREGADLSIANRSLERGRQLAASLGASACRLADLDMVMPGVDTIINCTSVGMREGDGQLIEGRLLRPSQTVFDIVYNRETELLQDARAAGAKAIDGVMMLVYQGAKALQIWTGREADAAVMERAVREGLARRVSAGRK